MNPAALIASLALHALVGAWLWMALPDFGERLQAGRPITVELVDLAEADRALETPAETSPLPERQPTRTPPPGQAAPEPAPQPARAPEPQPAPVPRPEPEPEPAGAVVEAPAVEPPPTPDMATAVPEPEPDTETQPAPEPEPAAAPEPEPEPETAEAAAPPAAPQVASAPRRRPEMQVGEARAEPQAAPQPSPDTRPREEPESDPLDALLQSVEQLDRRVQSDETRDGTGSSDVAEATGRLADLRAQQLGRLIYDQIIGCWSVPAGLEGLRDVGAVDIRVAFDAQGRVLETRVEDERRLQTDRVFRAVAESANRAIHNCTPLRGMPAEHFDQWRLVILEFRPDQITAGG